MSGRGGMAANGGAMTGQGECFARAAKVRSPVQIVVGTRDPDFPDPAAEAIYAQELIGAHTEATIAMINGAGHYPQVELPAATASALLPFLAAVVHA